MAAKHNLFRVLSRNATTVAKTTKAQGDISSVFPSLSGKKPETLPSRFQDLKAQLVKGKEQEIQDSWFRLLASLREEIDKIKRLGSDVRRKDPRPERSALTNLIGHSIH